MGQNTVAVLLNDYSHEIEREGGEIGKRMVWAMNNWNPASLDGFFRVGRVIARGHSSDYQVVIAYGGGGWSIYDAKNLPYMPLSAMADCLKRHGWTAKPPPKRRRITTKELIAMQDRAVDALDAALGPEKEFKKR